MFPLKSFLNPSTNRFTERFESRCTTTGAWRPIRRITAGEPVTEPIVLALERGPCAAPAAQRSRGYSFFSQLVNARRTDNDREPNNYTTMRACRSMN